MENLFIILTSLATITFGFLFSKKLSNALIKQPRLAMSSHTNNSKIILNTFAIVSLLLSIVSIIRWWKIIIANSDSLLMGSWLFTIMVLGMFVQVISDNYKNGNTLFAVSASQLLYPLLFSIIVFYPTWLTSAKTNDQIFPFYASFLNGYYWRDILSSSKAKNTNGQI